MSNKVKKRKLEEVKAELLSSCVNILKEPPIAAAALTKRRDRALYFFIAGKLKSMSRRHIILSEKRINDVIYEIGMGEFQECPSSNTYNNVPSNPGAFQGYMSSLTNNNVNLL